MERKLYDAASKLPETSLDFYKIRPESKTVHRNRKWRAITALVVCIIFFVAMGSVAVEVKAYSDAIKFFDKYGLPTEGLSRGEIKAVYRDIITESFSYSKTAEVIVSSFSVEQIGGYELPQGNPTPQYIARLWDYFNQLNSANQQGIHYKYRTEYKEGQEYKLEGFVKGFIEKYDGNKPLWSVAVSEFYFDGHCSVGDGVIAYGKTPVFSHPSCAWMVKIDAEGNLVWKQMLDNGFEREEIAKVIENEDGSFAVISRGDLKYLCLSQYTADGKRMLFEKTQIGNYGIWNAARFGDGYIAQLANYATNEFSKIVKIDYEGNITDSFSYGSEESYYHVTDMIAYDGNIYLSAYAVPKHKDQIGGRQGEIANILNYLHTNKINNISSKELTKMLRDNYTAMLLVCDPTTGIPQTFYSVKGSFGGKLSLSNTGMLRWDVESITTSFYSPETNLFTIGGTCYVYRYSFNASGKLVSQKKTGEIVEFDR